MFGVLFIFSIIYKENVEDVEEVKITEDVEEVEITTGDGAGIVIENLYLEAKHLSSRRPQKSKVRL